MLRSPFTWHIRRVISKMQYSWWDSKTRIEDPSQRWDPAYKIWDLRWDPRTEMRDQSQRWNLEPETLKLQLGTQDLGHSSCVRLKTLEPYQNPIKESKT